MIKLCSVVGKLWIVGGGGGGGASPRATNDLSVFTTTETAPGYKCLLALSHLIHY